MNWKTKWLWRIYFFIFASLIVKTTYVFFDPKSDVHLYLEILYIFHPSYFLMYFYNLIQIVLNCFFLLPLLFFIMRVRFFSPQFLQCMFILRLVFDLIGHPFEMIQLSSIFYENPKMAIIIFLYSIFFYIPSYAACYQYAFQQDNRNS